MKKSALVIIIYYICYATATTLVTYNIQIDIENPCEQWPYNPNNAIQIDARWTCLDAYKAIIDQELSRFDECILIPPRHQRSIMETLIPAATAVVTNLLTTSHKTIETQNPDTTDLKKDVQRQTQELVSRREGWNQLLTDATHENHAFKEHYNTITDIVHHFPQYYIAPFRYFQLILRTAGDLRALHDACTKGQVAPRELYHLTKISAMLGNKQANTILRKFKVDKQQQKLIITFDISETIKSHNLYYTILVTVTIIITIIITITYYVHKRRAQKLNRKLADQDLRNKQNFV